MTATLPPGWSQRRLRFDAQMNPVKSELKLLDETEVSFVPMDAVGEFGGLRLDETRPVGDVLAGYTYFRDGDVCIAKITPCFENGKGAYAEGLEGGVAFGTTELHIIRPRSTASSRFLFYVSMAHDFRNIGESEMLGAGGQKRIPERFIRDWRAPLPPLEVQERIAAFLDEKTAQIDGLIARKQALLERLTEKRQAIITAAVTKGLNPVAPMKDSGIDWLGQVPAHWEVKRLRFLTARPLKYGANAPADWDVAEWPRFVRITDVDSDGSLRPETFRSLPPEIARTFDLDEGDILLARSGATVGKSFIYRPEWGEACFAGYLVQARISDRHVAEYIYRFLNSSAYWSWVSANFIQSTIQNISAEKYANIWVPCPPRDEQAEIASFVATAINKVSNQTALIIWSIDRLIEYRAALITAAVTGQIKGLR